MDNKVYEKVASGKNLKEIFKEAKNLSTAESYLVHVETIGGAENNYIEGSKNDRREIENLYVSRENMTSLEMI